MTQTALLKPRNSISSLPEKFACFCCACGATFDIRVTGLCTFYVTTEQAYELANIRAKLDRILTQFRKESSDE